MALNRWSAIGRLGSYPEVRKTDSGALVAKFNVAVDDSYKDKSGNKVEHTQWIPCVVWNTQAEIAEKYLKKGMLIYVEGKLTIRQYEDKEGVKKYATEVVLSSFQMLERRDGIGSEPNQENAAKSPQNGGSGDFGEPPINEDLPF